MSISFYQLISFFFIYGFLGWCTEVCFQALSKGKLVNRGFLNGAICPIYGVGVVLVVWILEPLMSCGPILFAASVVLCSVLEWITGFILEKLFHEKWWDYSNEPFNIGGYICLRFSLMWGLACIFAVYIIHPTIEWLVSLVPFTPGIVILSVLGAIFLVDCIATLKTMISFTRELRRIDEGAAKIRMISDEITEDLYHKSMKVKDDAEKAKEGTAELKAKVQGEVSNIQIRARREALELIEKVEEEKQNASQKRQELERKLTRGQKRLLKAFPDVRSARHHEALAEMKLRLEKFKKNREDK